MSLLTADLRRVLHRRLVWGVLALCLVVLGVLQWQALGDLRSIAAGGKDLPQYVNCMAAQGGALKSGQSVDFYCADLARQFTGADVINKNVQLLGLVCATAAVVVGATVSGYDSSSGALSTWLVTEPRRGRVMAARAGAAGLASAAGAAVISAGFLVALNTLARSADPSTQRLDAAGVLGGSMRIAVVVASIAAVAAAIGLTVAGTGVVVAVLSAWPVIELLFPQLQPTQFLLLPNLRNLVTGNETYEIITCTSGNGMCHSATEALSPEFSASYTTGIIVVLLAIAAMLFRRRPV